MSTTVVASVLSRMSRVMVAWGLVGLLAYGCSSSLPAPSPTRSTRPYQVGGYWYQPLPHARGFQQQGTASWYGRKFHGRSTSSGEIYNMYAMTAAHKTLPLGTYVLVHNLRNQRQIKVRINDRGPFVRGRIIDLSYAAAEKIGMIGDGTAPVKITALAGSSMQSEPIAASAAFEQGSFTVQVGAFRQPENAQRLKRKLDSLYGVARITPCHNGTETLYRVYVGRKPELVRAEELERRLIQDGYSEAFVIAE